MTETLYALALLACPVGMGAMMWFMMRGGKQQDAASPVATASPGAGAEGESEVVALRAELDQLRAELRGERASSPTPTDERQH